MKIPTLLAFFAFWLAQSANAQTILHYGVTARDPRTLQSHMVFEGDTILEPGVATFAVNTSTRPVIEDGEAFDPRTTKYIRRGYEAYLRPMKYDVNANMLDVDFFIAYSTSKEGDSSMLVSAPIAQPTVVAHSVQFATVTSTINGGSSYRIKMDKTPVLVAKMTSGVELYLMLSVEKSD
jgi:hypothetical protein